MGTHLAVRSLTVPVGQHIRIETAVGEEQVLLAVRGHGLYRADAFTADADAQPFAPGNIAIVRMNGWCDIDSDGDAALVVIAVAAPQPAVGP